MGGRLEGKVALSSGAARGQGAVPAELLAKEGASAARGDARVLGSAAPGVG